MERKRINRLKVVLAEKGMTNKQLSEILDMTIFVRSRKWSNLAAVHSVKFKTSCSRDMPGIVFRQWG